jgi:hypothetical protein
MIKNKKLFYGILVVSISILGIMGISLLMYTLKPNVEDVKARHESSLMDMPGVVGVGIGECDKKPCIKVYLEKDSLELRNRIPKELEGFRVDIEVTGPFEALPK